MPYVIIKLADGDDIQRLYTRVYKKSGKDYYIEQWSVFDELPRDLQDKILKDLKTKLAGEDKLE